MAAGVAGVIWRKHYQWRNENMTAIGVAQPANGCRRRLLWLIIG